MSVLATWSDVSDVGHPAPTGAAAGVGRDSVTALRGAGEPVEV